ncbi:MAG TPA: choline/ethanolamine kinase family protein [Aestuariivirgaceae bacterium]|nr:choline/ethanolamine kinase family protein [Aestuariivirgaceae bacterium]
MSAAIERIKSLAIWKGAVEPQPLKGGLSNESFTVEDAGARFVVRLGRDFPMHHVFRDRERAVSAAAFAAGFAPELVHAEPGLMVFAFIDGRTFSELDVQANIGRIARLARSYHTTMPKHVRGPAALFWVFHVIRDYARTLEEGQSRMRAHLGRYLALAGQFEAAQVSLPIVFGHNDLLPANFIDDGRRIWLIDYEYAAFSTAMFDLAGIASNALFNPEQDRELLQAYFGREPALELVRSHAAMKCASLLREAMWSMVSEIHLETPGVDYLAYTAENLSRFDAALDSYQIRFGKVPA